MRIHAFAGEERIYSKTYYSIGGGFIVDEEHFGESVLDEVAVPGLTNLQRAAGALS